MPRMKYDVTEAQYATFVKKDRFVVWFGVKKVYFEDDSRIEYLLNKQTEAWGRVNSVQQALCVDKQGASCNTECADSAQIMCPVSYVICPVPIRAPMLDGRSLFMVATA